MNKIFILVSFVLLFSNANALENKKKYTVVLDINDKAHIVHIGESGFTNQNKYVDLALWDIKSKLKHSLKNKALNKLNTTILILDKKQFNISNKTLDFEYMFGAVEADKINLIFNKARSLESDYLIILKSSKNYGLTHETYAAGFDGYGFYSDARVISYDMRVNKSNASHFSLSAYIFDLKNKKYIGKKNVSKLKYFTSDRNLSSSEKSEIYQYVIDQEFDEKIMSKYKSLIFKEKINKKEIYDYYNNNNSHLEDDEYEENSWILMQSLYPLHHTPNDFHLVADIEKNKLKKHFLSMLPDVSSDVVKLLPL